MPADPPPSGSPAASHCHVCGAALPSDASFCLQCGARVQPVPPAPAPSAPSPKPVSSRNATLLGVISVAEGPVAVGATPPAPAPSPVRDAIPAGRGATMIGVAMDPRGATPAPGPSVPRSGTMLGVASPVAAPARPKAQPAPSGQTVGPFPSDDGHRRRAEAPPVFESPAQPPFGHRPLAFAQPAAHPEPPPFETRPRPKRSALWVVAGGALVAAVVGGAYVGVRFFGAAHHPQLQADVRVVDGAVRVHAVIPGGDARWHARVQGVDYPVDASGALEFPLSALSAETVGDVQVPLALRDPTGATSERTLHFVVGYRVQPDLEHLGDDPPRVHLRFRVPTGATLSIAGQPITLSGQLGVAEIPAPPPISSDAPSGYRSDRFPIEVHTADGVTIRGDYELRVPRLALRVEMPGPLSAVDAATVTVDGSLPRATRVLVGSTRATVMGDHFRAEVPLALGPNALVVVGYGPGGIAATTALTVYRGVTPQSYLASGGGDRGVGPLVTPTATPVRVRLRGRVINSTQSAGDLPSFQLLVSDAACPGRQCLAWVDLPPGALVRVNETVEVVGETHGTRSYVTQNGQRHNDAVVRALFLTRP